ncbi:MAG: DUF4270 domain-containing protein [Bacteroidia bacterium]|nr:DUF4270 domain-containing protein [Bacteroidia bacterium]
MLRALVPAALFIASLLAFSSCKKESDIGLGLQPGDDLLNAQFTDTLTLWTKTERDDSVRTDKSTVCVLGSNNDPLFGKTQASLYSQFLIPGSLQNINFGAGSTLDSMVLMLKYDFDFYGDTNTQQTFVVYQMTESINKDSSYYESDVKTIGPSPIGTVTFTPRPRTNVIIGNDTLPPHLRITIDPAFAATIFALSGQTGLSNNENFLQNLKGLYIAPNNPAQSPGQGALLYFSPKDTLTRLSLFYRESNNTAKVFSFVINNQTAYFGNYQHDYSSSSAITSQLNTTTGGPYSFTETHVHSLAGLRTRIEFPFLSRLYESNLGYKIAINKAELLIKTDAPSSADPNLPPNTRYLLASLNDEGEQQLLIDFLVPASNFDGNYDPDAGEYRINMAIYFQRLINGTEPNTGLLLKEIVPNNNARRSVIGSGSPLSAGQMKLRITYTRVN